MAISSSISPSDMMTLLVGFGGVLLGGVVTFLTETHFRRLSRKAEEKRDFSFIIACLARVSDELYSIYNYFAATLPDDKPDLVFANVRISSNINIPPIEPGFEKMFAISHKDELLWSEISLCFRRFNATISTLKTINEQRAAFQKLNNKNITILEGEDIASFEISSQDTESVMAIVSIENLYRDFLRLLLQDMDDCVDLIKKVNELSEKKFGKRNRPPTLKIESVFVSKPYLKNIGRFEFPGVPQSDTKLRFAVGRTQERNAPK